MKSKLYFSIISFLVCFKTYSQSYAYTGKAWSLNGAIHPLATFYQKGEKFKFNAMSGSIAISKKIFKGVYPTLGYSYTKTNQKINLNPRTIDHNSLSFNEGHTINTGILIQKHLLVTQNKRISTGCFIQSMSLIIAPEYNYLFTNGNRLNKSKGEFALKMGICLFNSYSGKASKNFIWDVYYRKGFIPIVSYNDQNGIQQFYKDEIGIQLRIVFRQRFDFLN